MKSVTKSPKGKMFTNPFLEAVSKSSPLGTLLTYTGIIASFLYLNYSSGTLLQPVKIIALYLSGLFVWTFFEYILHRYIFHWVGESNTIQRFHYSVHGYHHEYPLDETRLFMPPLPGIVLSSFFLTLFYLVLGNLTFVFTAGFVNGYLLYATVHYSTHRFRQPKLKFLKALWRHHNMHHFRTPEKAFGVSSPLWDYVFGTMPPKPQVREKRVLADLQVQPVSAK